MEVTHFIHCNLKQRSEDLMKMNVRSRYSQSDEYEYQTRLERINLDDERRHDVINGNGFIVSSPKAIKDDIKDLRSFVLNYNV